MKKLLGILLTTLFMAAMVLLGAAAGLTIFSVMKGEAPWQRADSAVADGSDPAGDAGSEDGTDGAGAEDGADDADGEAEEPGTAAIGEGDVGSCHVRIKGASAAQDFQGKEAIVVTYTWTNNGGSTASAYEMLRVKASQNGAGLDSAVVIDSEKFDFSHYMREIRPGRSANVQMAFHLNSRTTAVDVEISQLGDSSGDRVVMTFDLAELE